MDAFNERRLVCVEIAVIVDTKELMVSDSSRSDSMLSPTCFVISLVFFAVSPSWLTIAIPWAIISSVSPTRFSTFATISLTSCISLESSCVFSTHSWACEVCLIIPSLISSTAWVISVEWLLIIPDTSSTSFAECSNSSVAAVTLVTNFFVWRIMWFAESARFLNSSRPFTLTSTVRSPLATSPNFLEKRLILVWIPTTVKIPIVSATIQASTTRITVMLRMVSACFTIVYTGTIAQTVEPTLCQNTTFSFLEIFINQFSSILRYKSYNTSIAQINLSD